MIVYDLSCDEGHRFEGWFGSSEDYTEQREQGLVACPQCGSDAVGKAPMAPAVPRKGNRLPVAQSPSRQAMTRGPMPPAIPAML